MPARMMHNLAVAFAPAFVLDAGSRPVNWMRDFLISVASGFAVAILSAIFLRRPSRGSGPSQNMSMRTKGGGGAVQYLLIFALGAAAALAYLHVRPQF